jgi:hypothetical protein
MKNPEKFNAFDGKRFVVRADEKLTAFVELERAIHDFAVSLILIIARQRNSRG